MRAEIVTIGDELCRGEITDTNSAWLAGQLWDLDITVSWITSCRDVADDIRAALTTAASRVDVVLVSGGLGPTEDDLTVDVVSDLIGVEPEVDEPSRQRMHDRYAGTGLVLGASRLRQVRAPRGAVVVANPVGSAPGFEVELASGGRAVPVSCFPGVPAEMKAIFAAGVRARLAAHRDRRGEAVERIARRIYRVFGRGESDIAGSMDGALDGVPGATLHYQVKFPEVLVKIVVRAGEQADADRRLGELDKIVRERLGRHLYGTDDDSLPAAVGRALAAAGATVATAESCTGGMIGGLLTDVAGSSAYFAGGAITYSNAEKVRQLGVGEDTLERHGAVSEECVREMAAGARERFGADYAVAVSGVAGPGGGSPDKPVGTVWLAVAGPGGCKARRVRWPGKRARVRTLAAYLALAMVLHAARDDVGSAG